MRPIKPVRGLLLPSLCASLVVGEPPFAHPEGRFALLHAHASALQACVKSTAQCAELGPSMDDFSNSPKPPTRVQRLSMALDAPRIRKLLSLPQKLTDHCEEVPEWDGLLEGPVCA